jgi:hypothetical protein
MDFPYNLQKILYNCVSYLDYKPVWKDLIISYPEKSIPRA